MQINPATLSGTGQLKWVNLKSPAAVSSTSTPAPGTSSATFNGALQEASSSAENKMATFTSTASTEGLLWQQLSGTDPGYTSIVPGTTISGEITETVPTDYEELIQTASAKYGVPADLIKAVIDTESSFNPSVVSSAGAKGLMQLMDGTANGLGVSDPFDPAQSIDGGVRYLSYQLKRFDGQEKMALAAYNAGPGRVAKLGVSNDQELMAKLEELPKETQSYIFKIERARAQYAV
ncbi:lytic transglycosylase domain-containing protein [Paenibacillus albidus]|uniref:lytic transglycosylase domain-containing protein n=1 Tax=Paenibacillus albidus TaxID=2041023 RepID=UPI001BEAB148|nr:lytic transglycosylase domain-containing protein [Paenibacillus albidus]MBT2288094.1 lytic transglycosylase domain-containing protein [Paenibacillus albidus]